VKWSRSLCLTLAVSLCAVAAPAQERPDFTGTWTRLDIWPSPDSTEIEEISQAGDQITLRVESRSRFGSLGGIYKGDHVYAIGGPLESKKAPDGSVRSVAVAWDAGRLVFVRTTIEGANTTTEREAWSLEDAGDLLVKDRRTTDWRGVRDERIAFQRSDGKGGGFQMFGAGAKSCRTWMSERGSADGRASLQWVLGYVSAYGIHRSYRVAAGLDAPGRLRPTNTEEIGQIIDNYCGERHPDSDLFRAAEDLLRQLGASRPQPPPPVREYR
jgi:hypothetical protein